MVSGLLAAAAPHALPLGTPQPPHSQHAVSASLPTWKSVVGYGNHEEWVIKQMQNSYPRFFVHPIIQGLCRDVLNRFQLNDRGIGCMVFPTQAAAARCLKSLKGVAVPNTTTNSARFMLDTLSCDSGPEDLHWASFHVVLFPNSLSHDAAAFWRDTGDGITSRHAEYCHAWLDFMKSDSEDPVLRTQPAKSVTNAAGQPRIFIRSALAEELSMRSVIAKLATSEQMGQPEVTTSEVFFYPTGMSAISATARALATLSERSDAVTYGFVYAETNKVIPSCGYHHYSFYGRGSLQELAQLETELAAGRRITMLFCDFPGNPQLVSPDLHRIRKLADKYSFAVVCDDTVGTFVNIDLLPYVDILITSLTKMFSGGSDVMGGSVVVNPRSPFHAAVTQRLTALFDAANFPSDVITLAKNCADFVPRVRQCNASALAVVNLLSSHPAIEEVYHPSTVSKKPNYDRYRRAAGGYGNLLSIIFREPSSARVFYDALDVCKGTSFGTNFTLAVPFIQLYPFEEQDFIESYGIPKHLIRLSVGLESEAQILNVINIALAEVEKSEGICSNGR